MEKNLSLLTDFYELTMMQGFFLSGISERISIFDLYCRKNPFGNGYIIAAGLQQAIDYILNINFSDDDINFLASQNCFTNDFLNYLRHFKFTGDIFAVKEGDLVFPNEPLLVVRAPIIQAQFLESTLLNIINHQTLIATKAARIRQAVGNDVIFEFGLRRAQAPDAAIFGTRASIIGGFDATSNVLAAKLFDIPVSGTHSHSWIMSFPSEYDAFCEYARQFPDNCILLIDTYNTLKSGILNAIKVFKEMFQKGIKPKKFGVRLDSGDFAYLTKEIRKMLDNENLFDADIVVSNDLDENLISALKLQDAKINTWGIGTKLITADTNPSLGGVYKLVAIENENGVMQPKIKISENPEKISTPCFKQIFRIYENKSNKIKADLLGLYDEKFLTDNDLTIFDPNAPWKKMTFQKNSYTIRKMLTPIILNGKKVYDFPSISKIKNYCSSQLDTLWDEYKRIVNPEIMPVDLSNDLLHVKNSLLNEFV